MVLSALHTLLHMGSESSGLTNVGPTLEIIASTVVDVSAQSQQPAESLTL